MRWLGLALPLLAACSDDADPSPAPASGDAGGQVVIAADASAPPMVAPSTTTEASTTMSLAPNDGGVVPIDAALQDGAPRESGGPLVITLPTRAVSCGGSECTTTNNRTCCQAWSKDTGFTGNPSCTTHAACSSEHAPFGDANRAVVHDCDEPSDCSGGQVCCFVRYGAPVTADLFSSELVGPGASRLCMELSNCNAGMMSISGVAGIPLGLLACKTSADCKDGTQCTAEEANSTTTGKGGAARPGVMVCK